MEASKINNVFFRRLVIACVLVWAIPVVVYSQIPVPENHWSIKALSELADKGLVPGYNSTDFRIRNTYTREDMAQILSTVIDRYRMLSSEYTPGDLDTINSLAKEYELEMMDYAEPSNLYEYIPEVNVPVTHWAYGLFAELAEKGLLPGEKGSSFMTGRIYTRREMAELTVKILEMKKKNPELFKPDILLSLEYLEAEFDDEIKGKKRETRKPPETQRPRGGTPGMGSPAKTGGIKKYSVKGASNVTYQVSNAIKNRFNNRISFETGGPFFKTYFSGNMDNDNNPESDIEFGGGYNFNVSRKMVEVHSDLYNRSRDFSIFAGDLSSIDFARGTTVGASNMKGAIASAPGGDTGLDRISAFWGNDKEGRPVALLRFEDLQDDGALMGASIIKEITRPGVSVKTFSFDMKRSDPLADSFVELAKVYMGGFAIYSEAEKSIGPDEKYKFKLAYRKYRDFLLDHNSPEQYRGRSGGNSENEKSIYAAMGMRVNEKTFLILDRDHAYTQENGRRTNVYYALEHRLSDRWNAAAGNEEEKGGPAAEKERSFKVMHSRPARTVYSSTWKRSRRTSGPSSTTRFNFSTPFRGDGKFMYSFTRRKASDKRTNTSVFRLNLKYRSNIMLSMSYNYTRTAESRFDTNMSWKF